MSDKKPLTKDQENDRVDRVIDSAVAQLSEHLSSVQIIGTKLELDGTTTPFSRGSGDLFARQGATRSWIENGGLA